MKAEIRIFTSAIGGSADFVARVMARELARGLRRRVTVKNHDSGTAPIDAVAAASADGDTLLVSGGALWIQPLTQVGAARDVFCDFAPITLVASAPNILVVHPSLEITSTSELIARARAQPGKLVYLAGPAGSSSHLAGELFKRMTGVDIVHAPYAKGGGIIDELIAGNAHFTFGTAAAVVPYIESGKLRALAVTSARRSLLRPALPTVAESGLPRFESTTSIGLFAPAETPVSTIADLNRESVRILRDTGIREELLAAGLEAVGNSQQECADGIRADRARLSA